MPIFRKNHDDDRLLENLLKGDSQNRHFENQLYEKYSYLIREGVWKYRLIEDDSSIIYSDTILTVIEHLYSNRFEGRSGLKTYVHQIFSNKCVDFIRKKATNKAAVYRTDSLSEVLYQMPDEARTVVQELIEEQDFELLKQRLRELSEKCRSMLWAWGEGYSDKEIAEQLDYQSAAVAKTSRLRCLEKLRELYQNGKTTL